VFRKTRKYFLMVHVDAMEASRAEWNLQSSNAAVIHLLESQGRRQANQCSGTGTEQTEVKFVGS
jgi:hypothetical protein